MLAINDNLPIHEDKTKGVYVKGLSEIYVSSVDEVYDVMRQGTASRSVASTNMNQESSRSHSIFALAITQKNMETGSSKSGQLFLVDLAGSEKVGKTGATGQLLEEAKKINKSLSALGNVINALTDGKSTHIPYRDSKLTRILQESLGGNSRTTLIVNCSPSSYNVQETLSTLKFGTRAKNIKNRPKINAELSASELKSQLQKAQSQISLMAEYVAALERETQSWRSGEHVSEEMWATKSSADAAKKSYSAPTTPRPRSQISPPARPNSDDSSEDFLQWENELQDRLTDRETAIRALERMIKESNAENVALTQREAELIEANEKFEDDILKLKQDLGKLQYESKEAQITMDSLKELNAETTADLDITRKQLYELSLQNQEKTERAERRDRRKKEKIRKMANGFEFFSYRDASVADDDLDSSKDLSLSDNKKDWIGEALAALDNDQDIKSGQKSSLKMYLLESREFIYRAEQVLDARIEEIEDQISRREDIEAKLKTLEELTKQFVDDDAVSAARLEEYITSKQIILENMLLDAKRDLGMSISDNRRLRKIIANEERRLSATDRSSSVSSNSEFLAISVSSSSTGVSITPSTSIQTPSATPASPSSSVPSSPTKSAAKFHSMKQQLEDFEMVKRSLMRDLQNRCERVVELEIQLDEMQDINKSMTKNSTASKGQLKRMAFLERNLDQLTQVQRALVDQNAQLKREVAMNERKLRLRNEKVLALEQSLHATQERLANETETFDRKMSQLIERYDDAKMFRRQAEGLGGSSPTSGNANQRIVKPLRGGGLGSSPLTAYLRGGNTPESGRLDSSPIALSSPSVSKRSSWFSRN